jgi:peptide/nickel transport system permease protein
VDQAHDERYQLMQAAAESGRTVADKLEQVVAAVFEFSLRNRDHVNLSKLSGHSIPRIILTDILPYIASYVVMAFILQISSAILYEASLSIIGLGPRTTEVPTLGLMMNWAMIYQAHILGKWWAYLPVLLTIALITFSMNLMNTGLDQVFNPALRD